MSLQYVVACVFLVVCVAAAVLAMSHGWRHRRERTGSLVPSVPAPPEMLGTVLMGPSAATYVGTTIAGQWLDRVVAHGLGNRAQAWVTVAASGVLIDRMGASAVFIPAAELRSVRADRKIAGRAYAADDLTVFTWTAADVALDSGVRLRHRTDREPIQAAALSLTSGASPTEPKEDRCQRKTDD